MEKFVVINDRTMDRSLLEWCRRHGSEIRDATPGTIDFLYGVCPVLTRDLFYSLPAHMEPVFTIIFSFLDQMNMVGDELNNYYNYYKFGIYRAWNEQLPRLLYRSMRDRFCRWCKHAENHRELRQGLPIQDWREEGERKGLEERRVKRRKLSPSIRRERDYREIEDGRRTEINRPGEDRGGGERFLTDYWEEFVKQDRAWRAVEREKLR